MPGRVRASSLTVRVAQILSDAAGRKVSNAEIARRMGVSPHQVGRYMNGTKSPNLEEFDTMCRIIGLDPMEVLKRAESTTGRPDQDAALRVIEDETT